MKHHIAVQPFPCLLACLMLTACGGGGDGSGGGSATTPPPPSPDFTISLAQNAVTVGVGDTSPVVSVSAKALNGFTSAVSVEITGLPSGATTSPASPFPLAAAGAQDVTLTIPPDANGGASVVTFRASSGALSHAANLSLTTVPCLTGGSEQTIQDALASASGFADLCPGAVFVVTGPIYMGSVFSTGSRIFTGGYPSDLNHKALIRIADHADSWPDGPGPAGFGYPIIGIGGDDITIRNIRLDGNRANNLYKAWSTLIAIAAGHRITIDSIYAVSPLGRPGILANSADCSDLTVTNNFIGSVGSHIVPTAADPVTWGDGMQVGCDHAYVAYNEIRDATDVGLILFRGKNSVFEFNHIENWASSAFGGLGADPEEAQDANGHALTTPFDFSGTVMRNNTVETCCGQHIHVALAVGVHLWCDTAANNATCASGKDLTYIDNQANGMFGYGLYVGGMSNVVVTGNVVTMTPLTWINCYVPGQNFYVLDHATGTFQGGYVDRTPLHWPCLGPTGPDEAAFYP